MKFSITNEQINDMAGRYIAKGGNVYTIPGSLNDNYIMEAQGCWVCIIKELYLNDWASCCTIKRYRTMPKKYAAVIDLLEAGDDDGAARKFFS